MTTDWPHLRSFEVTPTLSIILRVMHERAKGAASPFAAYVDAMHAGMPDNPIFWSQEAPLTKTHAPDPPRYQARSDKGYVSSPLRGRNWMR